MKLVLILGSFALLTACSRVVVLPLDPSGKELENVQQGVRYYLPKPYLLVTEVLGGEGDPSQGETKANSSTSQKGTTTNPKGNSDTKSDLAETKDKPKDAKVPPDTTTPASTPSSNTSFTMLTNNYQIKLIYLPDFSKPMALYIPFAFFGSATMKPTLQDGWMLTGLDATSDTKTSETITAMASLVTAAANAAKAGATGGQGLMADERISKSSRSLQALVPGLYEFEYTDQGKLKGLKKLAAFPVE